MVSWDLSLQCESYDTVAAPDELHLSLTGDSILVTAPFTVSTHTLAPTPILSSNPNCEF